MILHLEIRAEVFVCKYSYAYHGVYSTHTRAHYNGFTRLTYCVINIFLFKFVLIVHTVTPHTDISPEVVALVVVMCMVGVILVLVLVLGLVVWKRKRVYKHKK